MTYIKKALLLSLLLSTLAHADNKTNSCAAGQPIDIHGKAVDCSLEVYCTWAIDQGGIMPTSCAKGDIIWVDSDIKQSIPQICDFTKQIITTESGVTYCVYIGYIRPSIIPRGFEFPD